MLMVDKTLTLKTFDVCSKNLIESCCQRRYKKELKTISDTFGEYHKSQISYLLYLPKAKNVKYMLQINQKPKILKCICKNCYQNWMQYFEILYTCIRILLYLKNAENIIWSGFFASPPSGYQEAKKLIFLKPLKMYTNSLHTSA